MSNPSVVETVYACGIPSNFAAPTFVYSDETSIKIQWVAPLNNGGCAIFDYGVWRDSDGTGTTFTEVNPASTYVRNDPYTLSFTCTTFPATAVIGDQFRFKVIAYNLQGSVESEISAPMTLASVPGAPTNGPYSDPTVTNGN